MPNVERIIYTINHDSFWMLPYYQAGFVICLFICLVLAFFAIIDALNIKNEFIKSFLKMIIVAFNVWYLFYGCSNHFNDEIYVKETFLKQSMIINGDNYSRYFVLQKDKKHPLSDLIISEPQTKNDSLKVNKLNTNKIKANDYNIIKINKGKATLVKHDLKVNSKTQFTNNFSQ